MPSEPILAREIRLAEIKKLTHGLVADHGPPNTKAEIALLVTEVRRSLESASPHFYVLSYLAR